MTLKKIIHFFNSLLELMANFSIGKLHFSKVCYNKGDTPHKVCFDLDNYDPIKKFYFKNFLRKFNFFS